MPEKECFRATPQWHEYGSPTATTVAVGVVLCLVVLLGICLSAVCCARRKENKKKRALTHSLLEDTIPTHENIETIGMGDGLDDYRRRLTGIQGQRTMLTRYANSDEGKCCRRSIAVGVVVTIIITIIATLYTPQLPAYSLCEESVDWYSVLSGLVKFSVVGNTAMHFSLYNPNRYELTINSADAQFFYKNIQIGKGSISNLALESGSITDTIMHSSFHAGVGTATAMLTSHQLGALLVDVKLSLNSGVNVLNHPLAFATNHTVNSLNVAGEKSVEYCLCNSDL